MEVSKISIREGLREAVRTLIEKVDGIANFVFTPDGLTETESLCEVISKIGNAIKDYDGEILEKMEEEEVMVAEIVEADEFTLEINRVIGKAKRGFQPTVSATDFIFVKICDISTQRWDFQKTYMHPC